MKIKEGVTLAGIHILMRPVLRESERIWKEQGREKGVTITCAMGGTHKAASWHYYGLALDLRIRYFDESSREHVFKALKAALPDYDIILHKTHIHAEVGNTLAKRHGLLL